MPTMQHNRDRCWVLIFIGSQRHTADGLKHLFTHPVESAKGASTGLTSLFSRAGESLHSDPGETEDSRMKQLIGFSKSKREIAQKYHVDVYSTNRVLQDQLNTLAWADYGGGMTLSIATLPLGGPASVVYSSSNAVRLLNDASGRTVLLVPVDYLTWNEMLAGALEASDKDPGSSKKEIWLLGTASDLAQTKLKEKGWQIQTRVAGKIGINETGLLKKDNQ